MECVVAGIVNGWWSIETPSLISSKHTCAYTSTQTHTENTDTLVHTHTWGKSSFAFWDTMIVGKYCCLNLTDHVLLHICHRYLCMCICMCACVCIYNVKFYSFIYLFREKIRGWLTAWKSQLFPGDLTQVVSLLITDFTYSVSLRPKSWNL